MTCGIYLIKNNVNGKVYVGQSTNIQNRFKNHKYSLKRNSHGNSHLQNAYNKYGEECFEFIILEVCAECDLDFFERNYIQDYDSMNPKKGYNKESGGHLNKHLSEETKKKLSESHKGLLVGKNHPLWGKKGKLSPNYGKKMPEHVKESLRKANTGRKMPDHVKNALKKACLGRAPWNKGKNCPNLKGENHPMYGKHHTKESVIKISKGSNSTGFFRVSKQKDKRVVQGFSYRYIYPIEKGHNGKRKKLMSNDILKLEKKVKSKGLEWRILNESLAKQTIAESKELNSKRAKQHSTGVYRVIKHFDKTLKQGFDWRYQDFRDNKVVYISSVNPSDLKERVLNEGFDWIVVNEDKARECGLV